jgi:lipopolysaccharide transport system ATP-binding protein
MSLPAIEVTGLSKRYVIEHESRHDTLRDTLHHTARKLWRRFRWGTGFQHEEFWALRDVSFSVQPGEVVGIIGRNGAGKSTLLKILSRITEPTAGKITLRGRVASLLEVGTGFHADLTGRENIYLNGAILGMRRAEIRGKFDEIVAFAEVEKFLDTPVKRYSSGMYVRLAFAVAAHLEPEILIIDEVLAVGDARFQDRCLGKMRQVASSGRTVLFVSHNLSAVGSLCSRTILFNSGRLVKDGQTHEVLRRHMADDRPPSGAELIIPSSTRSLAATNAVRFSRICLLDLGGQPEKSFKMTEPFFIELEVEVAQSIPDLLIGWHLANADRQIVICSNHHDSEFGPLPVGRHVLRCRFLGLGLAPGEYQLTVAATSITSRSLFDAHVDCLDLEIMPLIYGDGAGRSKLLDGRPGIVRQTMPWHLLPSANHPL